MESVFSSPNAQAYSDASQRVIFQSPQGGLSIVPQPKKRVITRQCKLCDKEIRSNYNKHSALCCRKDKRRLSLFPGWTYLRDGKPVPMN